MDETRREGSTAKDDWHADANVIKGLEIILHERGGFHQQSAHGDAIGPMLLLGLYNRVDTLLDAQIDNLIAIVRQNDIDKIFADVVNITLDGCNQKFCLTVTG